MAARMFRGYPDVVTVEQLCQMLNIGRNSAYALVREGKIRSIRVGRSYRIPKRNVITYLEQQ